MLLSPQRRRSNTRQLSTVTDFLSLAWKQEQGDLKWMDFPPVTPVFTVPGAVCRAEVGLEMVKHNGDSVQPEGPRLCSSAAVGN